MKKIKTRKLSKKETLTLPVEFYITLVVPGDYKILIKSLKDITFWRVK